MAGGVRRKGETTRFVERCLASAFAKPYGAIRQLLGGCRTQRWEGSRPRPAAAGLFPKPSVFVDRVIRILL